MAVNSAIEIVAIGMVEEKVILLQVFPLQEEIIKLIKAVTEMLFEVG